MGWTSVRNRTGSSTLEMLKQHSSYHKGNIWYRKSPEGVVERETLVEDMAVGPGGAYGVLKITDHLTGDTYRIALVILTERKGGEFYWKEMTEQEGPNACFMPARLFKKLTPLDFFPQTNTWEYARTWRAAVQSYLDKKKQVVVPGNVLEFPNALKFTLSNSGAAKEVKRFRVYTWGKAKRFEALCDDGTTFLCRLTNRILCSDYVVHV